MQTQLVPLKKYYSLTGRNANHSELRVAVIPTYFGRVLFIEVFKYLQTKCILSASLYIICYEGLFLLVYVLVLWGLWRFSLTSSSVMERSCGANLRTKNKKQGLLCVCVNFLSAKQQLWWITSQLVHFADGMQIYLWPWDWEKMKSSYISEHSHSVLD